MKRISPSILTFGKMTYPEVTRRYNFLAKQALIVETSIACIAKKSSLSDEDMSEEFEFYMGELKKIISEKEQLKDRYPELFI